MFGIVDKNQKKQPGDRGFTLIELLVSIFIISLMSGAIMAGYSSGQKQYDISQTSQNLLAKLRQAQNMAIAGKMQGAVTPAGYGLYVVSPTQYKIFYNKAVDVTYQSKLYNGVAGNSVDVETVNLPVNVTLSTYGTVFFIPPEPVTYINGWNYGSQIFGITSGGNTKKMIVSSSGSIGSCVASCVGKICGSDGCGGSCSPGCLSGQTCDYSGTYCYYSFGSFVCSELYRQGLISEKIYLADDEYAKKYIDKETMAGYHFWARPLVGLMQKSKLVTRGVMVLAIPWSEHMAYLVGEREEDNSFGNFVNKIGVPVCRLLGKFLAIVKWGDFSTES